MRKLTAAVQKEIAAKVSDDAERKLVGTAYRNSDLDVDGCIQTVKDGTAAINTATPTKAVSQKSKATAAQKAKAAEDATNAKATEAAKKSKVLPAVPDGWTPGESREGFVRYARRLRSNGQPVSAYRLSAAKKGDETAIADALRKEFPQGTFVVVNHTTDAKAAFDSWADAYAYTCTMNNTSLARSVASAIGEQGLASLSSIVGTEVTVRAEAVEAAEAPAEA